MSTSIAMGASMALIIVLGLGSNMTTASKLPMTYMDTGVLLPEDLDLVPPPTAAPSAIAELQPADEDNNNTTVDLHPHEDTDESTSPADVAAALSRRRLEDARTDHRRLQAPVLGEDMCVYNNNHPSEMVCKYNPGAAGLAPGYYPPWMSKCAFHKTMEECATASVIPQKDGSPCCKWMTPVLPPPPVRACAFESAEELAASKCAIKLDSEKVSFVKHQTARG